MVRLRCEQLPGVAMLGVGNGHGKVYLVHTQQLVGLLKGQMERNACRRAVHAFLDSEAGRILNERDGGDMLAALQRGPLIQMMYTYRLHPREGGRPSGFVTVDGIKELMNGLPGADDTIKHKLREVFEPFLNPTIRSSRPVPFVSATPEQCARDDEEELIAESDACQAPPACHAEDVDGHTDVVFSIDC